VFVGEEKSSGKKFALKVSEWVSELELVSWWVSELVS
jgi:hypothetical protein